MTPSQVVAELTFQNYAFNRERSPHISPERWAKVYGPNAAQMEVRYLAEKAITKARATA